MIFVTVGSQKFPFDRLLKKVDELVRDRIIVEAFCDWSEFERWMERCDIVITHGGAGAMVNAIRRRKKAIAVPRMARYGEHVDDHQHELTQRLHTMNLLCACPDTEQLPEALKTVREHHYDTFPSNTQVFLASVDEFLRSL